MPAPTKEKYDGSFYEELSQIIRVSSQGVGNDRRSVCGMHGRKQT